LKRFSLSLTALDIVIVDAQSDLNIYTDMADGEIGGSGQAASCCRPPADGAAPGTKQETVCCSGKEPSCCSAACEEVTNSDGAGCSGTASKTQEGETASWDLASIDINEWAGKIFDPLGPVYSLTLRRVLSNLCG
jgi:hypothetical protein